MKEHCSKCGKELSVEDKGFCSNCGNYQTKNKEKGINLGRTLSWKILLPLSVIFYIIFASKSFGIIGDSFGLLTAITFALGIISLIGSIFSRMGSLFSGEKK
jgi:nicotinamide riboside transporter PnuC